MTTSTKDRLAEATGADNITHATVAPLDAAKKPISIPNPRGQEDESGPAHRSKRREEDSSV